jgi:exopolysaccharide biosynthesis protein
MATVLYNGLGQTIEVGATGLEKNSTMDAISIEYGRINNTNYYFTHIPRYTNEGKLFTPKIAMTTADGKVGSNIVSALTYAKRENKVFTINGGIYNTSTYVPHGQTIVNGVSLTNSLDKNTFSNPSSVSDTECYPLCIDAFGNLSSPYAQGVDTATMIAAGVKYAVTGWGELITDFAKASQDKFGDLYTNTEKAPRQVIGQYQNGDYFTFACDGTRGSITNNSGMTYAQVADFLISKGVKYAYVLDGGGSTETILGKRSINPIFENTEGRKVPTVIYFSVDE